MDARRVEGTQRVVALVLCAFACASCGDTREETSGASSAPTGTAPTTATATPPPDAPLLDQSGQLAATSASDGRGRYDRYFVDVGANDRLVITLTSSAFDPILEVTPPGSGALVNDDWQGDRTRSQIELMASTAGSMKVEVRSYTREGVGAYRLSVRRVADGAPVARADGNVPALTVPNLTVPVLTAGQSVDGELAAGDHALSGGEVFDSYVVRADAAVQVAVTGNGGEAPRTTLVGPDGLTLEAREGSYQAPDRGTYRLQVIGRAGQRYRVAISSGDGDAAPVLARTHHRFNDTLSRLGGSDDAQGGAPPAGNPAAPSAPLLVRIGDRLNGNLSTTDARLPSGELYDVYELQVSAPGEDATVELESSAFDTFLRVEGPGGQRWENDDYGGTLNSRVEVPLSQPGAYHIVVTSYRAGDTGPYALKVLSQRAAAPPVASAGGAGAPPAPAVPEQQITGQLRRGDTTLQSGEYVDEHRFTWPLGARIHLEARSSDFDTYLIVYPPNGPQRDNDDMNPGQSLDAGMDLQVDQPGEWRVLVTSYRAGMTGDYTLVVMGGQAGQGAGAAPVTAPSPAGTPSPTPTPAAGGRTETGTLAQGDQTLPTGEFSDAFTMTFTPRSAVRIRLDSSEFDPYLIVRSPSGHQEDNDDLTPGQLGSGIDIPVAEPGEYRIVVTSYRPGETGRYTLTLSEGPSVVAPPSPVAGTQPPTAPGTPGGPAAVPTPSGGGRVWGLFAGITDYPGTQNDLPECANDARKLAEAVRLQGNMPPDQEFLLTDGQATAANIRQAMATIASRVRPDDVVVFFFSGHGGQTDSSSDTRELDSRDEYLVAYDGNLMDDELGQLFDRINARIALVAIDACFAGGFSKDIITRPGRVGMFSSEEDVTSAVASRFQAGGYLSHFLRLGIQGEADDDPQNNILTVGELTHYTWVQFGRHASDVRMSMGYQHLVVDRGAVRTNEVLWAVSR